MKLRNKRTGEIVEAVDIDMYTDSVYLKISDGEFNNNTIEYDSLAELNEEWEDYQEPKECWIINILGIVEYTHFRNRDETEMLREIGNYFETKEEAEKAVEKLKAWKRLRDKGFRFELWDYDGGNYQEKISTGRILFRVADEKEVDKDLDLLFNGGEE